MDFNKPRVAVYYDVLPTTGWRNDGAPLWMLWNLRKIINGETMTDLQKAGGFTDGTNVVHLSPINKKEFYGKFDLNVLVDYGEENLGIPIDWEIPHPNAYWACDTHIDRKGYLYRLKRAKQFDHVFLCHKAQIESFIKDGIDPAKIHYLPVAAEPDCYRPYPVMKKWNWCFIGHLNSTHRVDLVDRFVKEFGLGDGKGYFGHRILGLTGHNVLDDAAKKYSMSRLAINDSISDDLNMRTMEVMATGTPLLTQENVPLLELFEPGKHLLTFKTIDEAVEKAKMILNDNEILTELGQAGLKEVLDKHTYKHRALEILKTTLQWEPKGELQPC
jgi:glycosyltransferase involved in cell wall biosynthesis